MEGHTEVLFDPTDPALRQDPYPSYRRLRSVAPAWRSPDGVLYLSRYEDCFTLFRSPALSYETGDTAAFERLLSDDAETRRQQIEGMRKSRTVLEMDPPEHTKVRALMNRAFTPRVVETSRPMVEGYVTELLDGVDAVDAPSVDFVSQFAVLLPILVICDLLAVPPNERHQFIAIGHAVTRSVDPDVPVDEKVAANQRLRDYIATLVAIRRDHPGEDLMSRLIEAFDDGQLGAEHELLSNTGLLLLAGFESTTNLITNAIYQLLEHPDSLADLRADPGALRSTIEEVLRFDPPVHMMRPRTITADVVIGGVDLHAGDAVVPLLAAANRDPDEFRDPDVFDIRRESNRHLGFGVGHHLCIGAALARMEAQVAVWRVFERFPELALADDEPATFRPHLTVRGFETLHVRLRASQSPVVR